jgi:hypothetical protein
MPRTSKSLVLFVVSAAIVFDALDLSITQIALPNIGADLDMYGEPSPVAGVGR